MLDIFQYDFMVRAFMAGFAIAIIAPMVGIFLVTRRYAFMADTLAHVSFAGVAAAFLLGFEPIITALLLSIGTSLTVEKLRSSGKVLGEAGLAIFLSGGLALASVLISASRGLNLNLSGVLFGSIATVTTLDLQLILGLGVVVLFTIFFLYRQLFAISLDEELATVSGLPVTRLNRILVILAAIIVSLSMRIVGILLVGALMVIPVIAAMQYKKSFFATFIISIIISLFSVISGLFVSYYLGWASGGTITLIAITIFVTSSLINLRRN
ncbi:metal ABC transporter permease [Candidatus Peregrinibacteria bacterium]|nr:metal ABC transporter permease [Candidatus Peregrinibacteria bacterium]